MKQNNAFNILWLIALLFFTPITGIILNYEIFSSRSVVVLSVWSIILLIPYVVIRRKSLYIAAASIIFLNGFINLFHWIILKCPLNAASIFVFLNTNYNEASEFMTIKRTPWLILLIPYITLFIFTLRNIPQLSLKSRGESIIWPTLWIFAIVFLTENIVNQRFLRLAVPDVERALIAFISESKEFRNLKQRDLYNLNTELTTYDSTLVTVIIGESCNRNHLSLYGYERKTSPRLSSRNDILTFDNVVSANSNTLRSVLNFLTENNAEHHRPIDSCINIFDVFNSSPYKTYWLSNQSPIGLWDNGVTNLAQNANVVTFVNINSSSSMESFQTKSFDHNLFEPFQSAIGDDENHKLVFLHLLGCHTNYSKRYPESFALFENSGDKRTRVINTYDNAIYYNDFIIDSIFSMLDSYTQHHTGVRVAAVYFSDHSENVYDEGDYAGHDYSNKIPNANVEIPFILWFSPSQREYLNEHNPNLGNQLHSPYMIDDLFHTIIDLGCVTTPCFDKTRSFVNADFDTTRERRLEDGSIYTPSH